MPGQNELPGAAWYPDPYGASTLRWWDGVQWTDAVHPPLDAPVTSPMAVPTSGSTLAIGAGTGTASSDSRAGGLSNSFPYLSQMDAQQSSSAPVVSQVVTSPTPTPQPISASFASTAAAPTGYVAQPPTGDPGFQVKSAPTAPVGYTPAPELPPASVGLRAAATTLDEDSTGRYEWSRESRAFDTFPGSAMPVSIAPRSSMTSSVVTGTASSWFIVFMPLLAIVGIVAVMMVIASVPEFRAVGFPSELLLASVAVAFYLVTVLFALADNRRMYSNGIDRPPHWAWALLSAPIYLIARLVAVRFETRRFAPGQLIVHVLLLAGGVFLALNFTSVVWPFLVSLMASI